MVPENFISSKARPVARNLKVNANLSSTDKESAGGDFLGLCEQKSSYKHVSDFGRLRSYDPFLIPAHALV